MIRRTHRRACSLGFGDREIIRAPAPCAEEPKISSQQPLGLLANEIALHAKLSEADRQAVLGLPHRVRKLDAGSYIVREGDQPMHCTLLIDGFAIRQKVTGTGARQILAICIPGDAVDLLNMFLAISDHGVQMLTQGTVADVPRQALQDLILTAPQVGAGIMQMTLIEASILREWVVNVGRRRARERIAHVLCEFAVRMQERGLDGTRSIELPMTQEQLADATGLTSVHVNRVLKGMEADGLISRRRRIVHFNDWRALQEAGDFSRRYLHIDDEEIVAHAQ